MTDEKYCMEKYSQLYMQYRELFESLLKEKGYDDKLKHKAFIQLSLLVKKEYEDKSRAITRANSLFNQEQSLSNLDELLDLYEFIKE